MNALHDLGLLTLSDDAELLHWSKTHVCKAVCGMLDRRLVFPAVLFTINLACSVTGFMASNWKKGTYWRSSAVCICDGVALR